MGVEHPQMDAIAAFFRSDPAYVPTPDLLDPTGKTPNQRALACALSLAWARLSKGRAPAISQADAVKRVSDLFDAMKRFGHQAVGAGYGNEQGAPDPHATLWMGAMATILREARLQKLANLQADAEQYFADHLDMLAPFCTPAGYRLPCGRAKALPGQPLRPSWTQDSWAMALLQGRSTSGLPKPADAGVIQILQDSASSFASILKRFATTTAKLSIPIRLLPLGGGGFVAALDHDEAMNDRLSWVRVDASGAIVEASNTLVNFVSPAGAAGLVIGGPGGLAPLPAPGPSVVAQPAAPAALPSPPPTSSFPSTNLTGPVARVGWDAPPPAAPSSSPPLPWPWWKRLLKALGL